MKKRGGGKKRKKKRDAGELGKRRKITVVGKETENKKSVCIK